MRTSPLHLAPAVEQLLADKKYSEALALLESIDASALEGVEYGRFCLLLAEAKMYLDDYGMGTVIDDAIEIFRCEADTEKYARAKFLKGWYSVALGAHAESQQHFLEAYASYLRCGDRHGAARTLNRMSFVAFQLGKMDIAIENLEECIRTYRADSDPSSLAITSMNLALLYLRSGLLRLSIDSYRNVRDRLLQSDERHTIMLLSMSSLPFALRGDLKEAKETIAKCVPYLDTYPREKAIYYENLGLIHILAGEYPQARRALLTGLSLSVRIAPESALVSQTKRLLADLHIAMEKHDLAQRYAEQALEVAEKIGQKVEIAACWRVFAQVAAARGEADVGRNWYRKALNLFALISSRYELAVSRYQAASSGLLDGGERMALLYLAKEYFESEQVAPYIEKVNGALCLAVPTALAVPGSDGGWTTVIAVNPVMLTKLNLARNVARSAMAVMLTGETGVGKDIVARYIHEQSGRAGAFVTLNSAAFPSELIEAELFGVVKGAYTGAVDRPGLFAQADGGTLYLNEIADSTPAFQAKLLEVLDTRQIRPVGGIAWRDVDVRVIAATNHDLAKRIKEGLFRMDLFQRLNQINIELPPLRDRREDIPALVEYFLTKLGKAENGNRRAAMRLGRLLGRQEWPGNVRELEKFVERIWFLGGGSLRKLLTLAADHARGDDRNRLLDILNACDWNQREAARLIGCSEGTVRNRIRRYGLHRE